MLHYSRPLNTKVVVEHFLKEVLHYNYADEYVRDSSGKRVHIVSRILDAELGVQRFGRNDQTLHMESMREESWRSNEKRWILRKQIVNELLGMERLDDDEKIKIKKGGALPKGGVKNEKKAYIIIGLPASGKSGIASKLADEYGAIILDTDYSKRKLPEFNEHTYGASIVNAESSSIIWKFDRPEYGFKSLLRICLENKHNIVIPTIGHSPTDINDTAEGLRAKNYEVHLILVEATKDEATRRAIARFRDTGRYIPLGLIFDGYGNDPSYCYYFLRTAVPENFTSFGVLVRKNFVTYRTDCYRDSPVLKYDLTENVLQVS